MGVKFVKGATTVAIESEGERGYTRRLDKPQAFGRSAANVLYVYDKGTGIQRFSVVLAGLSDSEKSSLQTFFHTITNGMELDFVYTDETGESFNARFLSPELVWEKYGRNAWTISYEVEVW